jgi:predicted secreted hydrolase
VVASKPAALHGGAGWVSFGAAGGSYYYSRTAMRATGTLAVGSRTLRVDGTAWFDHQWGDFIAIGGGWDWFAVNLDDGTDVTLSLVRAPDGSPSLVYGTLVGSNGGARHLGAGDFEVSATGRWTSSATGAVYPAGWTVTIPAEQLAISVVPTIPQQELDARDSTGNVYWEGSQRVTATRAGTTLGGQAYVELTGYPPRR